MSLSLLNSYDIEYNGTTNCARMDLCADTAADLATTFDGIALLGGSTCIDIATGDFYRLTTTGIWVKQPNPNAWANVYTKDETDALLQAIVDGELKRSDIYRGYQIPATDGDGNPIDLNNLTDYGTYYCADGTTAAQLLNSPITTSGFIMINFSTGNRVRLFLAVSANTPRMFIQARTGGVWRTIRQFAMLDEVQADENMLGYAWGRYNVAESTGDVNPSTTRIGTPDYFEIPTGTNTLVYSPMFDGVRGDVFYLFYDAGKVYHNQYIGWVSAGVPVKVPSDAKYYRLCFRKPNNDTIYVSDMIRCTRNYQ